MMPERDPVAKVVTRLNQSTARQLGLLLEVTDWGSHVRPNMGQRPEAVILEQLGIDTWDIFIGPLWLKFGSPTGTDDPVTRTPFVSGAREEFTLDRDADLHNRGESRGRDPGPRQRKRQRRMPCEPKDQVRVIERA